MLMLRILHHLQQKPENYLKQEKCILTSLLFVAQFLLSTLGLLISAFSDSYRSSSAGSGFGVPDDISSCRKHEIFHF